MQVDGTGGGLLDQQGHCDLLGPDWHLHWSDGHTPGQLLPEVAMADGPAMLFVELLELLLELLFELQPPRSSLRLPERA